MDDDIDLLTRHLSLQDFRAIRGELYKALTELRKLRSADRALRALFNGGPDTSCRTVWDDGLECVSVPMAELRDALDGKIPVPQAAFDALRETPPWLAKSDD